MNELPSEKILRYAKEMRSTDWIAFGGNRFSQEKWEEMHPIDEYKENYFIKALLRYLDESHDI